MNGMAQHPAGFGRLQGWALAVGALCLAGATAAAYLHAGLREAYFRAYLFSWLFCLGLSLGSLMWMMMHHLMRAHWSRAILRPAEAASLNLGLLAVLFIPILLKPHYLYPWSWPQLLNDDPVMIHRQGYMNPTGFVVRFVIYFAIWLALAWVLVSGSRSYDQNRRPATARRMRAISAAGIPLIIFSMTLAGVDWMMSREAHWFSSIFGFIVCVGQAFSGLLLLILALNCLGRRSELEGAATPQVFHDLGNLVLTLVILWAYLSFAQFLISWTGNIRSDIGWYYPRLHGLYGGIGCFLIFFHFFLPFFLLLMRQNKRQPQVLARIAALLLAFRLLSDYWLVIPTGFVLPGNKEIMDTGLSWLNVALPLGLVGIWLAAFLWRLGRWPLLAQAIQDDALSVPKVNHGDTAAHPA